VENSRNENLLFLVAFGFQQRCTNGLQLVLRANILEERIPKESAAFSYLFTLDVQWSEPLTANTVLGIQANTVKGKW
jgi:hypothetical protein